MTLLGRVNHKAYLFTSGRKGLIDKIRSEIDHSSDIVWVHCASVGEFEQGRPLIEQYKSENPDKKILLTFFSPSGYELRKNYSKADWVYYLPIDLKRNAVAFLDTVQPSMALFIKYEYWFNYLFELKRRNIPTYVVSAIFMPGQRFFSWYGSIFRKMLECFSHIFVQDVMSKKLLEAIGIHNVTVTGDTRFDRVKSVAAAGKDIPQIEMFSKGHSCWVAGSTWPTDEKIIVSALRKLPDNKLIIAPHEVDKKHIENLLTLFKDYKVVRYTELSDREINEQLKSILEAADIMIIDTIGILSSVYRYCDFAYIGGGFGTGIHNILEAATYGVPVLFGPKYTRFKEAVDLVAQGGANSIATHEELEIWCGRYLNDSGLRKGNGKICFDYISKNIGATRKVLDGIYRMNRDN
ncbi:MAG: glycosyltransferase N-terminal domain-containing protein [Rikenellaceae bacterium]|nr:glycosyltransferase N-terminal domain-containing protein [Rikenellaceae bacterium]